jgi:hypothetical protein
VFFGNFAGALTVAVFMAIILTMGMGAAPSAVGQKISEARTLGYGAAGASGMLTIFVRAAMYNWMMSTSVVAAMMSTSVWGKIMAMWLPIWMFLLLGFKHSIVNMHLFQLGIMLGDQFTEVGYFIYNEILVVIDNLVGGLTFGGGLIYATRFKESPKRNAGVARFAWPTFRGGAEAGKPQFPRRAAGDRRRAGAEGHRRRRRGRRQFQRHRTPGGQVRGCQPARRLLGHLRCMDDPHRRHPCDRRRQRLAAWPKPRDRQHRSRHAPHLVRPDPDGP